MWQEAGWEVSRPLDVANPQIREENIILKREAEDANKNAKAEAIDKQPGATQQLSAEVLEGHRKEIDELQVMQSNRVNSQ